MKSIEPVTNNQAIQNNRQKLIKLRRLNGLFIIKIGGAGVKVAKNLALKNDPGHGLVNITATIDVESATGSMIRHTARQEGDQRGQVLRFGQFGKSHTVG